MTMKKYYKLALASCLTFCSIGSQAGIDTQTIQQTLNQAGLNAPVLGTQDSPLSGISTIKLGNGGQILISDDLRYLVAGSLEANPSSITPINPAMMADQPAGTPVSAAYKKALLANMSALPNMNEHSAFFHTNLPSLLWGVSGKGGVPFLVSKDGKYLASGDIGVLHDGQFSANDEAFEIAKNRHVLHALPEAALAIYPAIGKERAVVYVATDIHCPYCRMFHEKIHEFNQKGITIKAIGYPVYDESAKPMRKLWCETDNAKRATLLSAGMKGIFDKDTSCQSPVIDQTFLQTQALGIYATPAIYSDKGELFMGDFTGKSFYEFLGL